MTGVYVHVPFCRSRCPYCDFAVSLQRSPSDYEAYVRSLCREIRTRVSSREEVGSVFFGGGTPSLLPMPQWRELWACLRERFEISRTAEVTTEANPGTLDRATLRELRALGVNRLSIGAQTFRAELLSKLARGHDASEVKVSVEAAREVGFQNISLDLMFGLPGQSLSDWQRDLELALAMPVTHLSAYALTIEPNTPFESLYRDRGSDEEVCTMYEYLQDRLKREGWLQYEVSNFALPGYESRHNLNYWTMEDYWGFGVAAHEYRNGQRLAHLRDLDDYLEAPCKQVPLPHEPAIESLMLGLRSVRGISRSQVSDTKLAVLESFLEAGFLESHPGGQLVPTQQGFAVADEMAARLMAT